MKDDRVSTVNSRNIRRLLRDVITVASVGIVYFLAHKISFIFPDSEKILMAVWPAGGIGLAALLLTRRRLWPFILIALFIAGNTANFISGRPIAASIGFMTANVLESLLSALFITRFSKVVRFDRVSQIVQLIIAAVFINGATACAGAGTAALTSGAPFWHFWRTWWIADGLGMLLVTPLIVTLSDIRSLIRSVKIIPLLEWLIFMAVCCTLSVFLFDNATLARIYFIDPYLIAIVAAWAAVRFGVRGTAAAFTVIACILLTSPAVRTGPLFQGGDSMDIRLLQAQLFIGVFLSTGYFLAAGFVQMRRAEHIARQSEERWQFALENSGDGLWDWDALTNTVYYSDQWKAMLGFRPEEIGGTFAEWDMRLYPDDRERTYALLNRHLAGETPFYESEHRLRCKDGSYTWILARGKVIRRTADGKPVRIIGTHFDMTERKRTEHQLTILTGAQSALLRADDSEEICRIVARQIHSLIGDSIVFTSLLDEASQAVRVIDVQGLGITVPGVFPVDPFTMSIPIAQMTDGELAVYRSGRLERLIDGIYALSARTIPRALAATTERLLGITGVFTMGFLMGDEHLGGVSILARGDISPHRSGIEQIVTLAAIAIQRQLAADRLAESGEKYRALFESAGDAIFIHDVAARMLAVNDLACERLGYTHDELMSLTIAQVDSPDEAPNAPGRIEQLMEQGHLSFETVHIRKDGTLVPTEVSARRIAWEGRSAMMSICRDITERKQAEAALIQVDKLASLGTLATGIAHEINQPLMAISMALDNLSLRQADAAYIGAKIPDMKGYIRRITNIIDGVRTFAHEQKAEPGGTFSVNESIRNVLDMMGAQYRVHDITLAESLAGELPVVAGELYRFEQVVLNLLTNAKYAVEEKAKTAAADYRREITISTARERSSVVLRIRDNGSGMGEDVQRQLFTPFFTTKPTGEGTGMGLSIIYGIVKSMGGEISVESIPGDHTEFSVHLPIGTGDAPVAIDDVFGG